jgi:ribose transport system substrate-binding protein
VYFGANNYQAGKLAGLALARFAAEQWGGSFDRVVLVESSSVGPNVQARLTGVLVGIRERLGAVPDSQVIHLDGRSRQETSREVVAGLLAKLKRGSRLLISGFNDQTALGALQAVRAAHRERDVALVGQNASEEGRQELRKPKSRLIASIAYFPERYGSKVIHLARSILNREPVPPAVYTDHVVLDHSNLDRFYRN